MWIMINVRLFCNYKPTFYDIQNKTIWDNYVPNILQSNILYIWACTVQCWGFVAAISRWWVNVTRYFKHRTTAQTTKFICFISILPLLKCNITSTDLWTQSFAVREKQERRFYGRMPRIFGTKRDDLSGEWNKLWTRSLVIYMVLVLQKVHTLSVKKITCFHGTWRFMTVLTTVHQWILSSAKWIWSPLHYPTSVWYI